MRRSKLITNKILILLILSGLFNLFSYGFDQLVIQSEIKMRHLEKKVKLNRVKIESLSYTLNNISDLYIEIGKTSNSFYRDLSVIIINSAAFEQKNNNHFTRIYGERSTNVQKSYVNKFVELVKNFNYKTNEIYRIFKENFSSAKEFENFTHETNYKEVLKIKDLIIDENIYLDMKYISKHLPSGSYNLYADIREKIKALMSIGGNLRHLEIIMTDEYINQFEVFENSLSIYSLNQNKINYYILLGIISQILAILFILLFFKELLKKSKLK